MACVISILERSDTAIRRTSGSERRRAPLDPMVSGLWFGGAGFGTQQAFSPRYLFHSGALAVGLLAALNTWRIVGAGTPRVAQLAMRGIQCAVIFLSVFVFRGWRHGWQASAVMKIVRTQTLL